MMRGNNWYGAYGCSPMSGSLFGGWHYMSMIGIVIIIVALIVWDRRKNMRNESGAISALKEIYVKGDITEEEYLKRKNVIERK